uniref:WD repeat domain 4 n=1 Tax=Callorhinchus milii TaxID=7868 RepID=A0A4W3JHI2_CALMI
MCASLSAASFIFISHVHREATGPAQLNNAIVAFAFSPSGNYLAAIADNKQLILFHTRPWRCLSVRTAARRCTSLAIPQAEDRVLLADKSGDIYSFSIHQPQEAGHLQLGHLSMLLAVAVSPDDRYLVTSDRDEKIRVSFLEKPHVIEAFCLGHSEFVSELFIPPNHPQLLVSGSGDGTLRLWDFTRGKELHCCDLRSLEPWCRGSEERQVAVVRITHSLQGDYLAVLCDNFSAVHLVRLDVDSQQLVHEETLVLEPKVWDVSFDESARLWVLHRDQEQPVTLYTARGARWQKITEDTDLERLSDTVRTHWELFQGRVNAVSCCTNLYKVTLDNVAKYKQRKEQRLKERGNGLAPEEDKRRRVEGVREAVGDSSS